jgi:hypothetical protein
MGQGQFVDDVHVLPTHYVGMYLDIETRLWGTQNSKSECSLGKKRLGTSKFLF